jgi:hypothetical protein
MKQYVAIIIAYIILIINTVMLCGIIFKDDGSKNIGKTTQYIDNPSYLLINQRIVTPNKGIEIKATKAVIEVKKKSRTTLAIKSKPADIIVHSGVTENIYSAPTMNYEYVYSNSSNVYLMSSLFFDNRELYTDIQVGSGLILPIIDVPVIGTVGIKGASIHVGYNIFDNGVIGCGIMYNFKNNEVTPIISIGARL